MKSDETMQPGFASEEEKRHFRHKVYENCALSSEKTELILEGASQDEEIWSAVQQWLANGLMTTSVQIGRYTPNRIARLGFQAPAVFMVMLELRRDPNAMREIEAECPWLLSE